MRFQHMNAKKVSELRLLTLTFCADSLQIWKQISGLEVSLNAAYNFLDLVDKILWLHLIYI